MNPNPERNSDTEKRLEGLQWDGKYWGPQGAIALGMEYYGKALNSTDNQTIFWATVSLASLQYSASACALARCKKAKLNIFGVIVWGIKAVRLLLKSWRYVQRASTMAVLYGLTVSETDYDVYQSVGRQYYRLIRWTILWDREAAKTLDFVTDSIRKGIVTENCSRITQCFLHIGEAHICLLHIDRYNELGTKQATFDILLKVWSITQEIIGEAQESEVDVKTARQLTRIFRHLYEMSGELGDFSKLSGRVSARKMNQDVLIQLQRFKNLSGSKDQYEKAKV